MTASEFAEWVLLAEWPGDHSEAEFDTFSARWRKPIADEFRRVFGADFVDVSEMHPRQ